MKITIELNEEDLKTLILKELERRNGDIPFDEKLVSIQVKSKQNYKAEWETAAYKATYNAEI